MKGDIREIPKSCSSGRRQWPVRLTISHSTFFLVKSDISAFMHAHTYIFISILFSFLLSRQAISAPGPGQLWIHFTKANASKRLISILQFAFNMTNLILNTGLFNSQKTVIRGTAEGQTGLPPLGPQTCPNRTESSGSPFCPTFTLLKCSMNTQSDSSSRVVQTQSG